MMTEKDFAEAEVMRDRYLNDEIVREARAIVADLFAGPDSPGALALLEHSRTVGGGLTRSDAAAFAADLADLFPQS